VLTGRTAVGENGELVLRVRKIASPSLNEGWSWTGGGGSFLGGGGVLFWFVVVFGEGIE